MVMSIKWFSEIENVVVVVAWGGGLGWWLGPVCIRFCYSIRSVFTLNFTLSMPPVRTRSLGGHGRSSAMRNEADTASRQQAHILHLQTTGELGEEQERTQPRLTIRPAPIIYAPFVHLTTPFPHLMSWTLLIHQYVVYLARNVKNAPVAERLLGT
jgi:hypothetical protein